MLFEQAEVVQGDGIVWIDLKRFPVILNGPVDVLEGRPDPSPGRVSVGVVGLEGDRFVKLLEGLLLAAELEDADSAVVEQVL